MTAPAILLPILHFQAIYFQVFGGGSKGCSLSSDLWLECSVTTFFDDIFLQMFTAIRHFAAYQYMYSGNTGPENE